EKFDDNVKRGIYLHRSIDAFTDSHPVVQQSKSRLREKYRHYAGVIVDVFYDHFLAVHWQKYHKTPLEEYAAKTYGIVTAHHDILPARVQEFFPYMVRGNWLYNYSRVEGIARALTGMSRRTPFESKMDEAPNELIQYYDEFASEFESFFPDLQRSVSNF
ncbi:MAG TPA: acyl carrier protein phosphodiesterase, partial [Candidatus Nanoarchaeia archaeon]|nr:acyl carrier protein phosphodiesterase [Candidatus Nanoarchaeia archaeon]